MAPRKRKPVRRKPGTGMVRHKKGRALPYQASFPLGNDEYRNASFATAEEAEAWLDQLVKERDDVHIRRNIAAGSQTVQQFVSVWLAMKQQHVKAKTWQGYQYYLELAIALIGKLRLDEVTREDAQGVLGYYHRRDFKNVAQLRATLYQAFEYALEESYITRNPFAKTKAPRVQRRKAVVLTEEQRTALLEAAKIEDRSRRDPDVIPLRLIWHLYSRLGLRKGEGMALRWSDLDEDQQTITIRHQLTNVGSQTVEDIPKTARSERVIPLPTDMLEGLRQHRQQQRSAAQHHEHWQHTDLIFCATDGRALTVWYIQLRWEMLRARAPIPPDTTIHDLRHTAAYLLERNQVEESVRMALLGHSTGYIARHYADHATLEAIRSALERSGTPGDTPDRSGD